MGLITLNISVELICFLIALLSLAKAGVWRMQILYMFLICVTEILGRYLVKGLGYVDNAWLYNVFLVIEAFFVTFMFYQLLVGKTRHLKRYLAAFVAIFLVSYGYDLAVHGFLVFNDQCNTIVSACYCVMGMYYFYWLMNREEYIDILRFSPFWWVAGVILFYFGSTVLNIFHDALIHAKDHNLRRYMILFVNIVLYGFWSYSFILRRWNIGN